MTPMSLDLASLREGRTRMTTGWDARPGWLPRFARGDPYFSEFARKCITLAPGETFPLMEADGAGVVTRLYVTLSRRQQRALLRSLVIRAYWDGEENPSVLCPLGDLFGATFGRYREFDSRALALCSGGYLCTFPMPFADGARIEVTNESPLPVHLFFWGVTWTELPGLPEGLGRFHAHWRRTPAGAGQGPHLVADLRGRGHYVGTLLQAQNADRLLRWPPYRFVLPAGEGLGNLEGWEECWIDDDEEPSLHGTGAEEYFNTAWYFLSGRSTGWNQGVIGRSYVTGRVSAYRFHVDDPIPFRSSYRMVFRKGLLDEVRADYATVAYWYQEEPHAPLELPPRSAREPLSVAGHVAQIAGGSAAIVGGLAGLASWLV